jgi:hypothetical protein
MIDSLFYYPMTLHRGTISVSVLAPFVKNLPSVSGVVEEIYVRTQDTNPAGLPGANAYAPQAAGVQGGQGVYVWDAIDNRFRFVMPYEVICEGVVSGSFVDIYYALTGTGAAIPSGATVYRNGAIYTGTNFTTNDKAAWAVLQSPSIVAGSVKTVQGIGPDSNGNITLPFATETVAGLIRVGANLTVDSNGVLAATASSDYVLPAATNSTLGGVIVGQGIGVSGNGTINADVISVNGLQGTVVISANDITTGAFSAAQLGGAPGDNEILITNAAGVPTWVSTLPTANLPSAILGAVDYQGTFVPGTSTLPAAASGNKGWYYVASTAGTYTPPGGTELTFSAGDWLISNGTEWSTVNNGGAVTSVNGQTGAVTIQAVDNSDVSGVSLIVDGGASTGVVKLKTIVAGFGITITPDSNGNLLVACAGVSSFNTRQGAVTLELSDVTGVGGAPIASPAFTGTPTAPTATAGTDNTQIATTAFVMDAVASGVAGVASFNTRTGAVTLELSDITGAGGAPIASPAFTGAPTSTTPVPGDNSTNIATTAFVDNAIASGNAGMIVRYEFDAEAGQTSFPVTFAANSIVEVFKNGGIQLTSDYTTGGTGPVVMNLPCIAGDDVVITVQQQYAAENTMPITGGTFTGPVYGPTPTEGDDSTALATTAFVQEAISSIGESVTSFNTRTGAVTLEGSDISGAGGALVGSANTFTGANSFTGGSITVPTETSGTNNTTAASTAYVVNALGAYAPLASPSFTGVPLAPTAAVGTDTTQLATTAFVYGASQGASSIALTNANVTLSAAQYSVPVIVLTGTLTGSVVLTVPTTGQWDFLNTTTGAFTVTVSNGSGATQLVPQSTTAFTPLVSNATEGVVALAASSSGVTSFNTRTGAVTLQLSDITGAGGAPLASPAFTGTPTAPTPTAGNNSTDIATTAFVATSYAPLASPALTGTPTAPTATVGVDTTQVATTAFVYGASQGSSSVTLTNANVTLTAAQYSVPIIVLTGTLTANLNVTYPTTGSWQVYNATTGSFTVTATNGSGATLAIPQGVVSEIISNSTAGILPSQPAAITGRLQVAAESYTVTALGSISGTQTLNLATASEWTMTITGATTIAFSNVPAAGNSQVVYIRFTNAGSAAITWPSGTQFPAGTAPTFTTSGVDLIGVKYDTTSSTYFVFVIGLNMET